MIRLLAYLWLLIQEGIFSNDANREKFELFMDSEGPPRLLVYYQPPDAGPENEHNNADPRLLLTYGDTEKIK